MSRIMSAALASAMLTLFSFLFAPAYARELSAREIFRSSQEAVVVIRKTDLFGKTFRGTGFFVGPNLIATNHHVVKEARSLSIEAADGTFLTFSHIRGEDPVADTALLEIVERFPHVLRFAPNELAEVGEPVYVIGNPQGYARSLSQGLVSGIRAQASSRMYQLTANVSQGSSGSPVINSSGEVIGIVFGRLPDEAQIVFATPAANLVALRDGRRPLLTAVAVPSSQSLFPEIQRGSLPSKDEVSPSSTAKNTIRIGVPNWDTAIVIAHVLKEIIERHFRLQVELIHTRNDEILAGIEQADRSFDIHPDVWLPNHRRLLTDRAYLSQSRYEAPQGICIPRYVLTRFSIRHRKDLNNPAVARLFDNDNDGRGEIWIGEDDWQSSKIERLKARDYRYATHFDLVTGRERDLYQSLDRLAAVQRPVAFYCYGPHWVLRKHDLIMLRERPYSPKCFHLAEGDGADWFDRSHASCRGPVATAHRAYSRYVAKELPRLAAFLDRVTFDYEDLSDLIFRMVGTERDNATVARRWVERNEASLRQFLAAAPKR